MMAGRTALKLAIDVLHVPAQVRLMRSEPLPDGVLLLLRIAAGDADAEREAVAATRRSVETIRRAAAFFIEQILFASDADSYRVLGADAGASAVELRRNAGLLLKWLHPDRDSHDPRAVFASRVTGAWNDLKTPERRAAYDAQHGRAQAGRRQSKSATRGKRKNHLASALARRRARQREAWLAYQAGKLGFFRRALAMLLQRPV
jgi:hypothetical protein